MKRALIIAGIVLMTLLSFQPVSAVELQSDDRVAKVVDPEPGG